MQKKDEDGVKKMNLLQYFQMEGGVPACEHPMACTKVTWEWILPCTTIAIRWIRHCICGQYFYSYKENELGIPLPYYLINKIMEKYNI